MNNIINFPIKISKDVVKAKRFSDDIWNVSTQAIKDGIEPNYIAAILLTLAFNAAEGSFGELDESDRNEKIQKLKEWLCSKALDRI